MFIRLLRHKRFQPSPVPDCNQPATNIPTSPLQYSNLSKIPTLWRNPSPLNILLYCNPIEPIQPHVRYPEIDTQGQMLFPEQPRTATSAFSPPPNFTRGTVRSNLPEKYRETRYPYQNNEGGPSTFSTLLQTQFISRLSRGGNISKEGGLLLE